MILYEGLENALKEKGIRKTDLALRLGISTRTKFQIIGSCRCSVKRKK